jgi:uncharacterized OsmC-like protein
VEVRGIPMANDAISCTAEGTNEIVDRIIVLTKIHVHYTLRLPADAPRDKVDRSLETHVSKCPTAQSIKDSVEVTWTADFVQAAPSA